MKRKWMVLRSVISKPLRSPCACRRAQMPWAQKEGQDREVSKTGRSRFPSGCGGRNKLETSGSNFVIRGKEWEALRFDQHLDIFCCCGSATSGWAAVKRADVEGKKGEGRAGLPSSLVMSLITLLWGTLDFTVRTSYPYTPESN